MHVSDVLRMHESDRKWLKHKLRTGYSGETIVVTHHAPHEASVTPKYKTQLLSAAFASNLQDLLGFNSLWIHGHTHASLDYEIEGTRIICNPRGYFNMANHAARSFDEYKLIDVKSNDYGLNP